MVLENRSTNKDFFKGYFLSFCHSSICLGQRKQSKNLHGGCCWSCVDCTGNTYTNMSNQVKCKRCLRNYFHHFHTTCKQVEDVFFKFDEYWSITIATSGSFGIITLLLTLFFFIYHHQTPVIRASSRGMCYLIMVGIALLFLLPLTVIGKPTVLKCKLMPIGLGVTLSINIGR